MSSRFKQGCTEGNAGDESGQAPFEVLMPAVWTSPFVFNSPHSGRVYPRSFLRASRLDTHAIRYSEDAYVDELFVSCVASGSPLMRAHFPRAWLDVNREPYELDPRLFSGPLPGYANTRSLRVASGLGTIARVVGENREIYADRLPVEEGLARIETVYKPYHRTLENLLNYAQERFSQAILVDCHSMPSLGRAHGRQGAIDIVVGDRFGLSCAGWITDTALRALRACGFRVMHNKPYAGGYITEHHGEPERNRHALQIELNRRLYMDEARLIKARSFKDVAYAMNTLTDALNAAFLERTGASSLPLAAE